MEPAAPVVGVTPLAAAEQKSTLYKSRAVSIQYVQDHLHIFDNVDEDDSDGDGDEDKDEDDEGPRSSVLNVTTRVVSS